LIGSMGGPVEGRPAAVAFDCDGTIADTESLSVEAWRRTLADRGLHVGDGELDVLVGWPFAVNWARFVDRVDLGPEASFRAGLRAHFLALFEADVEIHTDVVDVMHRLVEADVPLAIVSSSNRAHVARVLERAGVAGLATHVLASEDTELHKPDPAPYAEACRRLGVGPAAVTAVEDTATGATSARRARLFTVGVQRRHSTAALHDACDRVVVQLDLAALSRGSGSPAGPPAARH